MQRFNPGPQVPVSDFPKVFVAFCKRFRGKGKDQLGADVDERPDTEASRRDRPPWHHDSGTRSGRAYARGDDEVADHPDGSSAASRSRGSKKKLGRVAHGRDEDTFDDDALAAYASPSPSPRRSSFTESMLGMSPTNWPLSELMGLAGQQQQHHQAQLEQHQGGMSRQPVLPQGTMQQNVGSGKPHMVLQPPAHPPRGMPLLPASASQPPRAPPPPTHAPKVGGLRDQPFGVGQVMGQVSYQSYPQRSHEQPWGCGQNVGSQFASHEGSECLSMQQMGPPKAMRHAGPSHQEQFGHGGGYYPQAEMQGLWGMAKPSAAVSPQTRYNGTGWMSAGGS